jgi:hypothetical protein
VERHPAAVARDHEALAGHAGHFHLPQEHAATDRKSKRR